MDFKPLYKKATRKVMRTVNEHFTKKGHGWPLAYSLLINDIFYAAHGYHLETFFLECLKKSKINYTLLVDKGELRITKSNKKKKPGKLNWLFSLDEPKKQKRKKK